ncbi:hypothetical protein Lal_00039879, partial [Lupinus albus]
MIQKRNPRNNTSFVRRLVKLDYQDRQSILEHEALVLPNLLSESCDTLLVTLNNSVRNGNDLMDIVSNSLFNEVHPSILKNNVVKIWGRSETHGKNQSRGRRKIKVNGHSQSHM